MAGLVDVIDYPLGSAVAPDIYVPPAAGGATDPTGVFDVLVGNIPFIAAYDANAPYIRSTVPTKKQQIDTSAEPGEQTISDWWLRSQSSFHCGAGRLFAEPQGSADTLSAFQYHTSQGVDVWTQGQASLLKSCGLVASTNSLAGIVGATDAAGTPYLLGWSGSTLTRYSLDTSTDVVTSSSITWGGATTIQAVVTDGSNYYACCSSGVYQGLVASGSGSMIWNGGTNMVAGWVKQRLIVGIDNALYELGVPNTTGAPTLPPANYSHPNAAWCWTSISEGPDAIYAAGFAGGNSAVYKLLLDTSVDPPELTPAITAATLPYGELVYSISGYMGGYLTLGTNRGVRICQISTTGAGSFNVLAPSVKLDSTTTPCYATLGDDRFVYVAYGNAMPDGNSGLARIDLSQLTADSRFAWAPDLQSHTTGAVLGVAHWGRRKAFLVQGSGVYFEHGSALEPTGYLETGKIRYHTLEPKLFKGVRMRCAPLQGSLQVTVYDTQGGANTLAAISTVGTVDPGNQALALPAQELVSLRFTLTSDGSGLQSPTFRGYQLKALPAGARQRQEVLVLKCYDEEKDRSGNVIGGAGWAWSRIQRVEALEEAADAVVVQHLTADQASYASRLVVIDSTEFRQTTPPEAENGRGGVLRVTVRSIT